jgi:hypothetical protein
MKLAGAFFCCVMATSICGCTSSRSAARYGEGVAYAGIGEAKILRKFYIRKFEIDEEYKALISPVQIRSLVPELLRSRPGEGDVPVDVAVRVGPRRQSGAWSIVFAFLYGIVPTWQNVEVSATVEIFVADGRSDTFRSDCIFDDSFKISVCSPLGLLPYPKKEGFQENECKQGIFLNRGRVWYGRMFATAISKCIAQQLQRHAMDRLTVPDVDFSFEEEE